MGFYDTVLEDCKNMPPIIVPLRRATVVRVQNVMDYYATEIDDTSQFNKQLGCLAPPFAEMWIETDAPSTYRVLGNVSAWPVHGFRHAGALVEASRNDDLGWDVKVLHLYDIASVVTPSGAQYMRYPYLNTTFQLDSAGMILEHTSIIAMSKAMSPILQDLVRWNHDIFADVIWLSLSFLNCKNVAMDETVPAIAQTPEQRRRNIWPKPEHAFKTIHITPFKAKPQTVGIVTSDPAYHQRLHIVRGHFHTYTSEAPLFGKPGLVGQFWIPQHTSGKAKEDITADYTIDV